MTNPNRAGSVKIALALSLFAAGCDSLIVDNSSVETGDDDQGGGAGNAGGGGGGSANGPMITIDFTPSSEDLVNPERGYYVGLNLLTSSASNVRASGHTMAIALVRLDAYRDLDLDSEFLTGLDEGFARVRAAGIKVVLRFMYNASFAADASKARVIGHIAQLKPLLQANADVIAVMQAGFIGAWGEWHSSTNGLENDTDRRDIVAALLDALPESRAVQIRTPMYKEGIYPGGPLTDEEAFTGSDRARVGHHNDCFLASASDQGTYASPVENWESFVAEDGRFTPIGGETCAVYAPKTDCAAAVGEMETNHWSFLNSEYRDEVLAGWDAQGCGGEIRRRLGARFALTRAAHSEAVAPGGILDLELDITNDGFASAFNERPVYAVISQGSVRHFVRLAAANPRRWPSGETTTLTTRLRVPADLAPGTYQLAVWLPDAAASLRDDPRYAVRLANQGAWDDETGDNVITRALAIDPAAAGDVDPSATDLVEL